MRLFQAHDVDEETPVQFLGVYTTKWQPEWGEPQIMFREVDDPVYEAAPDLLAACEAVQPALYGLLCKEWGHPNTWPTPEQAQGAFVYTQLKAAIAKVQGESDDTAL